MKILLINPPRFKKISVIREIRCAGLTPGSIYPPLKLAYTAALLKNNGFESKIIDSNAEDHNWDELREIIKKESPQIVIFTSSPSTMANDAQVAKICKEIDKNIITVLDDTHIAPVMSQRVLNQFIQIDILLNSGSENTALKICQSPADLAQIKGIAFRKNKEVVENEQPPNFDIGNQPLPLYDGLPIKKYTSISTSRRKPFAMITTSVGCPFDCSFCIVGGATVYRGYGKKWQAKTPEKVIKEIEYLVNNFKVRSIYFFDETFTVDKDRVEKICQLIIEKRFKIEWACNSRTDTIDDNTIKLMKEAGCWKICFGVESGSQKVLDLASKKTNLEQTRKVFKIAKKAGICATASTMIGLPGETKETLEQTMQFIKSLHPYRAQILITIPYPGTRLYEEIKKQGFLEKDYSFTGYDAYGICDEPALRTEHLSASELQTQQKKMIYKFYLSPYFFIQMIKNIKSWNYIVNLFKALKQLIIK